MPDLIPVFAAQCSYCEATVAGENGCIVSDAPNASVHGKSCIVRDASDVRLDSEGAE